MKSILCCLVVCLLLSVSAGRQLHQTTRSTASATSTSGTAAVATASASSSSSSSTSSDGTERAASHRHGHIDVYFLVDLTVNVPGRLDVLKQYARGIVGEIFKISSSVRIGVGSYLDVESNFDFRKVVDLTYDQEDAIGGLTELDFLVGSVGQESQLFALEAVATDDGIGFRTDSLKIIVWIGDSPGMDPIVHSTEQSAIAALVHAGAHVIAIDSGSLDITGQGKRIATETDGILLKANEDGLFETVALTVSSDDSSSQASSFASGDFTYVSSSAGGNTATVIGPLSLPDAIVEGVLTIVEAES